MTLLETLRKYEPEVRIQRDEELAISAMKKKNGMLRRLIWSFVVTPLFCYVVIGAVLLTYFNNTDNNPTIKILPFVVFVWMTIRAGQRNIAIKSATKRLNESLDRMATLEGVPSNYQNSNAISAFINYVTTSQCDTIKECINLYHTNLRHNQQMQKLEAIHETLSDMDEDVEDMHRRAR